MVKSRLFSLQRNRKKNSPCFGLAARVLESVFERKKMKMIKDSKYEENKEKIEEAHPGKNCIF